MDGNKRVKSNWKAKMDLGWDDVEAEVVGESPNKMCWLIRLDGQTRVRSVHKKFLEFVDMA